MATRDYTDFTADMGTIWGTVSYSLAFTYQDRGKLLNLLSEWRVGAEAGI